MNDQQLLRYSRHILLDEIGIEGQEKMLAASVLVVGCGGLGAAALPYLAASGVGKLIIADHDTIDDTNLQRQTTFTEVDIGQAKAQVMAGRLKAVNSACDITALTEKLDEARLTELMHTADDGTCALFGVFSPLVGIIGATQAAEALKILIGAGEPAHGKLTTYNALTAKWQKFRVHKNPDCGVCGKPHRP